MKNQLSNVHSIITSITPNQITSERAALATVSKIKKALQELAYILEVVLQKDDFLAMRLVFEEYEGDDPAFTQTLINATKDMISKCKESQQTKNGFSFIESVGPNLSEQQKMFDKIMLSIQEKVKKYFPGSWQIFKP